MNRGRRSFLPFLAASSLLGGACSGPSGSQDQSRDGSPGAPSASDASGSSSGAGDSSGSESGSQGDGGGPSDAGGGSDVWANPVEGGPTGAGPSVPGSVTVSPAMTTGKIPSGFIGLSYEKSHLTDSFFTGSNAPLIAMLELLGPSVLRIGGNSVDETTWQPSAPPTDGGTIGKTIGTADVDNLHDFLAATGWTTIYAVGLKSSTPAAAGAEGAYVATTLGPLLYGFEIGNEIDLYGWPVSQIISSWSAEANAITTSAPGAKLTGPAYAYVTGDVSTFATAEASSLSLLTQHHYIGPPGSMAQMLSIDTGLSSYLQPLSTAVATNHIADGWRMDETNSYYSHGSPGVSDAFASALWVLDYSFACAQAGAVGLNFHGGGAGQDGPTPFIYTPIEELNGAVTGAQPIFYGMLLFTLVGTGSVLQTTATARSEAGALNFTAYAVGLQDGTTRVVLVNKDATNTVHASVDVGATASSASAIYLQGPSLTALSGVTLAGAAISPAGAWTPGAPIALATSGQVVTVDVPAASAALVQVQ
jgi:hypothetical protein